jgi:hypothetical protein
VRARKTGDITTKCDKSPQNMTSVGLAPLFLCRSISGFQFTSAASGVLNGERDRLGCRFRRPAEKPVHKLICPTRLSVFIRARPWGPSARPEKRPENDRFYQTAESVSENVGQASSLTVHGASLPRVSGGKIRRHPNGRDGALRRPGQGTSFQNDNGFQSRDFISTVL